MIPDLFPHEEKVHYVTMVCQINASTTQLFAPPTPGGARRTHLSPETLNTIPSGCLHLTGCFWYKKYCRCQKSSAMRRCFTRKYINEGPCFLCLSKTDFIVAGVHFLDAFHFVQHMLGLKCCSRQNSSHGFSFFSPYSHRLLLISSKSSTYKEITQAKGRKQNELFSLTRNHAQRIV